MKIAVRRTRGDRQARAQSSAGMTLIELLISVTIIAIGMAGILTLVLASIASNNRNKRDTTATMLSQSVLEQILQVGAAGGTFTMTDCLGNSFTINATGAASPGNGAGITNGAIDFTATISPSSGYNMNYTICRANGQTAVYDVRWNVTTLESNGTTQVLVAANPVASKDGRSAAIPITLTGISAGAIN